MTRTIRLIGLLPLLLAGGCLLPNEKTKGDIGTPKFQVKCGGDCLELKTRPGPNQHALVRKVDELLKDQRQATIRDLLERNVEDAIACLRGRDARQLPSVAELVIARELDRLMEHRAGKGWADFVQGRTTGGIGRAESCLQQSLEAAKSEQWARVESNLSHNDTTMGSFPIHRVYAYLLRSEALRHLGKNKEACDRWQQAAAHAAKLNPRMQMPVLWEKVAGQRPVSVSWPSEIAVMAQALPDRLAGEARTPSFPAEAIVWFTIGQSRLNRGETSEALTAFKRADTNGASRDWDDFLLLHQAKALLAMQQTPAATGLLTALIERSQTSPWRASALTLLGSGKLNDGHVEQALAFLREAFNSQDPNHLWPADAMANLGIAFLMTGNEAKGIESLHQAQERFGQTGSIGGLLLCLENEANYWLKNGRTNEHRRVNERIRQIENQ